MDINSAKSQWNINFYWYRNEVCPERLAFWREPGLLAFVSTTLSVRIINSKCSCACLVCRKVIGPNLTCPTACHGHVILHLNNQVTVAFLEENLRASLHACSKWSGRSGSGFGWTSHFGIVHAQMNESCMQQLMHLFLHL